MRCTRCAAMLIPGQDHVCFAIEAEKDRMKEITGDGHCPLQRAIDIVNHPSHYTSGSVECIDAIAAATVNLTGLEAVCTANAIKYLWRWKQKNGTEDLKKAQWYINKLLDIQK